MSESNRKVVLITGAAPYLGGASTWQPLREAAPEYDFVDLDLLHVPANGDFFAEAQAAIKRVISGGACAVVVHGAAAALVLTAIARSGVRIPMLLLSPLLVTKDSLRLRIFRALARGPLRGLLVSVARSKHERLLKDPEYVRKQMTVMVRHDNITADLLDEARKRIASPQTQTTIERTPQTLIHILTPTDTARQLYGEALYGCAPMDVKVRRRIPGIVLESAWSAPMIDAPEKVAKHLRQLLAADSKAKVEHTAASMNQHLFALKKNSVRRDCKWLTSRR